MVNVPQAGPLAVVSGVVTPIALPICKAINRAPFHPIIRSVKGPTLYHEEMVRVDPCSPLVFFPRLFAKLPG